METTKEATVEQTPNGKRATSDGWFVVNARDVVWSQHESFGASGRFEGEPGGFPHLGVNIRMLQPGQPNCYYHRESMQEGFLVLSGECIALINGEERRLGTWDFFHCAPGTDHVFVGAGSGPCLILMFGARSASETITYPVHPLALKYGAGVQKETDNPQEAYAGLTPRKAVPAPPEALALLGSGPIPRA